MVTDLSEAVTMPRVEDFALLRAWRAGDRRAGDALVRRYYHRVLRFFELRSRFAEDLTQRTFLGCVEGRERMRNDAGFRAYLFGIARKQLLRELDDRRRDDRLASFEEPAAPSGPGMSTIVARREEQHLMLRALAGVNADTQILIGLHYWEGLLPSEIATVLEVPPSTIRTRLARAREALRERISQTEASPMRAAVETEVEAWVRSLGQMDLSTQQIPVMPILARAADDDA